MKLSELLKMLKEAGCVPTRHGKEHDEWYSKKTGKTFRVPRHSKEMATGTVNRILKDAGIK